MDGPGPFAIYAPMQDILDFMQEFLEYMQGTKYGHGSHLGTISSIAVAKLSYCRVESYGFSTDIDRSPQDELACPIVEWRVIP